MNGRCMHRTQDGDRPGNSTARRGALFNYFLMYLILSSTMIGGAGLCMHIALRSDQVDTAVALQLQQLRNLERQFRQDVGELPAVQLVDGQLICRLASIADLDPEDPVNQQEVTWTADGSVVRRTMMVGGKETQRSRYAFAAGSLATIETPEAGSIVIRIQEQSGHGVEMLMMRREQ